HGRHALSMLPGCPEPYTSKLCSPCTPGNLNRQRRILYTRKSTLENKVNNNTSAVRKTKITLANTQQPFTTTGWPFN
ncbi:hypothetical protein, partial [Enterobacter intestinihominis]